MEHSQQFHKAARFSDDYSYIIDSQGNRVEKTDPRVVFVWTIDSSIYVQKLVKSFFAYRGWRCRISGETTQSTLEYAKEISSGRECIAFRSISGSILKDLNENREDGEITVYYNHDQHGPCQNGAWPEIWKIYSDRVRMNDVIFFANFNYTNNYWGEGDSFANEMMAAVILGDIFDEAESVLRTIARDKESALKTFHDEVDKVAAAAQKGLKHVLKALNAWARCMAEIPLSATVQETPRVLVFGGLNTRMVHRPITRYFLNQGIMPKIIEFGEITTANEGERAFRYGFKRGRLEPRKIMKYWPMILDFFRPGSDWREIGAALKSRFNLTGIDLLTRILIRKAGKSGLLFDEHISFYKIIAEGHKYITSLSYAETILITGRYVNTIKSGMYDGLVQVGVFGCPPTINAHAVLRPIANASEMPYAAIDVEGPWISSNQTVLLEAIAVRAKRERERKIREKRN